MAVACTGSAEPLEDPPDSAVVQAPVPPPPPPPVRSVAVGDHVSCALLESGDVRCWGSNADGRAGLGDLGWSARPVSVGLTDVSSLDVGTSHACAVKRDGTVWCWGRNYAGELGLGDKVSRTTPTQVPELAGIVEVVTGGIHTCVRDGDGRVSCFGHFGAVGHRESVPATMPAAVEGLGPVKTLVAGEDITCAWPVDGKPVCWGFNSTTLLGKELGPALKAHPAAVLENAAVLAIGDRHACYADAEGRVACGGNDWNGQLGNQRVPDDAWCDVQTREVVCTWTDPVQEKPLSDSRCKRCKPPVDLPPAPDPRHEKRFADKTWFQQTRVTDAVGVAAGDGRTCVIGRDARLVCWGQHYSGNTDWSHRIAAPLAGLDQVVSASLASEHGCALRSDRTIRCFGFNRSGELGNGTVAEGIASEPIGEVAW